MGYAKSACSRALAFVWAWTVGLFVLALVLVFGTGYLIVDVSNDLVGNHSFWKEYYLFINLSNSISWLANLNRYAFVGSGPGFKPAPDLEFS